MDALFGRVLLSVTAFRMAHVYSLLPFLGLVGVGIVWCYQKVGGTSGKGMTLLFEAGHGDTQDIPLRLIPLVMVSTWLTHLFGGSAGREGVAVQIGGTLAHSIGKRLPIPNAGKQLLLTGMAAGFAGLFRTPIAATFFALEVLTAGVLEYSALLPALVASFSASACSGLLGLEKFTVALTDQVAFSAPLVGKLLLFGLVFGMAGGLFAFVLHKLKALFAQYLPNPLLRIFLFGVLVSGFSLLCWEGRYSGLGTNLIAMSFDSGIFSWDFALKWIFTVVTLAAGFQGGEVTPLFSHRRLFGRPAGDAVRPAHRLRSRPGLRRRLWQRQQHPAGAYAHRRGGLWLCLPALLLRGLRRGLPVQRRQLHLPPAKGALTALRKSQ